LAYLTGGVERIRHFKRCFRGKTLEAEGSGLAEIITENNYG